MRYQARLAMAAITAMFATANPAQAHSASPHFLIRGDTMAAPAGFVAMCQTDHTFCGTKTVSRHRSPRPSGREESPPVCPPSPWPSPT